MSTPKADPHLIAELLGKPLPKPGKTLASDQEIQELLARAKAEGRDLTDKEFFGALGIGPRPSPDARLRALAEVAAVREEKERLTAEADRLAKAAAEHEEHMAKMRPLIKAVMEE